MFGIIGITSTKPVSSSIINSLKKLEYRGYDSAGIATLLDGKINEVKCEGRVKALETNISKIKLSLIPSKSFPKFSEANTFETSNFENGI